MNEDDLEKHLGPVLSRTITPLRRQVRKPSNVALVGISAKWDGAQSFLLTVQLVALVDGKLRARTLNVPGGKLSVEQFVAGIREFLLDEGISPELRRGVRQVHVVGHELRAVLPILDSPLRDVAVKQVGKAHHGRLNSVKFDDGTWDVRLVDLTAFFPKMPLDEIARTVGLERLEADGPHLAELKDTNPERLHAHAVRDAEVVLRALADFREEMLADWEIDVLGRRTLASVASAIFRSHFFQSGPSPLRERRVVRRTKTKTGFREELRREQVFDGDWNVRVKACLSYWGGQSEAFQRGLLVGSFVECDAVSLYPHAAILQPLPHAGTQWVRLTNLAQVEEHEGFGTFRFAFPQEARYPCLPVNRNGVHRLVFPREGVSTCTLVEIRLALRMGATVELVDGYGFKPGERERDHGLAGYMRHFLKMKAAAQKGTLPYATAKLLANALLGKLAERLHGSELLDIEREAQSHGFEPGLGAFISNTPKLRSSLNQLPGVGSAFAPEWATLVLGRSRSIMAEITARGALLLSTDAIICPEGLDLRCEGLSALESVGSGMRLEHRADAIFVARARLYALLKRVENLKPGEKVIDRDDTWAVVRVARHGVRESEEEFAETLLACLREGRDVAPERVKARHLTAEAAAREGMAINALVTETVRTRFRWDNKRRLLDRDINIFNQSTDTAPYQSLTRMEAGERQRQVSSGAARPKQSRVPEQKVKEAIALLNSGMSVRKVAAELGMSRSTVTRIKKRVEEARAGSSTEEQATHAQGGGQ